MATPVSDRVSELLARLSGPLGTTLPPAFTSALRAVPRHLFLPDRFWVRDGNGGYLPIDRTLYPEAWWDAAYSDQPLVTQFTDGAPSSSASMPSMVLYELHLARLDGPGRRHQASGMQVIELGAGTGFNAGLLCALLGQEAVTTVDVDPVLVAQAAANLKAVGYAPTVTVADASAPDALPNGPYDRILATFSVDHIPDPWRAQLAPGGRIVTPWYSDWAAYGMLAADMAPNGTVHGHFHPHGSYMVMRTPNAAGTATHGLQEAAVDRAGPAEAPQPPARVPGPSRTGRTRLSPWAVTADPDTEFHLGLAVPHTSYEWDTTGEHAPVRFCLYSADGSTASVDHDGINPAEFTVIQNGSRALWDETEASYLRWERLGRPAVDRHGLTVTPDGTHHVWIDQPDTALTTRHNRPPRD
ncbi:methyltransferase domain-containing protein [Streptomyces sp. NPDC051994]|uniref:methyltransferase domain-containing protein n=1 Tax=unclassified Streptomyces TaxID=2593676 RepID=UPI00344366C8